MSSRFRGRKVVRCRGIRGPAAVTRAQEPSIDKRLRRLRRLHGASWSRTGTSPASASAIVVKDKLVFAKGYGYRDYGKKMPVHDAHDACRSRRTRSCSRPSRPGSSSDDGKLDWDKPIRQFVPSIRFYDDELDRTVTIRDMLSHRTGHHPARLDLVSSPTSRRRICSSVSSTSSRRQPPRSVFLYNNMMYSGSGYAVEILSGKPWETFVRDRILTPLGMTSTIVLDRRPC